MNNKAPCLVRRVVSYSLGGGKLSDQTYGDCKDCVEDTVVLENGTILILWIKKECERS